MIVVTATPILPSDESTAPSPTPEPIVPTVTNTPVPPSDENTLSSPTPEPMVPTVTNTPIPPTNEVTLPIPTPEPTATPLPVTVTVTGAVVNLRFGPGIRYYQAGQVQTDDLLLVTGRNADASWFQIADPINPAVRLWIFGSLTSLTVDAAKVGVAEVEIPIPPPVEATSCTRLHVINPNEQRLVQIADWYGLDLADIAYFNGLDPNAPLRTGSVICLAAPNNWQPPPPPVSASPLGLLPTPAECEQMVKGIDLQALGPNSESPLYVASRDGNYELVSCLLSAGADPEAGVQHGHTPLMEAVVQGHTDTVLVLLEFGANTETAEHESLYTALIKAAAYNRIDAIEVLLTAGAKLQAKDKDGFTPLHVAAVNGQVEAIGLLLEAGADVSGRSHLGYTPLYMAAINEQIFSAITLLEYGAEVNVQYDNGWTLLHESVARDSLLMYSMLVGYGFDSSAQTHDGETDLHIAARLGHREFLRALLLNAEVPNLNALDYHGNTPLHAAAQGGHRLVVEDLLLWGADPQSRNSAGWTPAELAATNGHDQLAERLQTVANQ